MLILFGLSIGSDNALAHIPLDKHPNDLETPNATV